MQQPLILSLDTSFVLNVSLLKGDKVLKHLFLDDGKKALENLPSVFKALEVNLSELDALAVSLGIGYSTSLRIGITFMKTLAYVLKKPIVGYENLSLIGKFVKSPEVRAPILKVSQNYYHRVFNNQVQSPILEGLPNCFSISIKGNASADLELDYFPFSIYGGLYALEELSKGGEFSPMSLEPIYMRPAL
ncbi:MAG: tRNA threonylcarbamoyladenosine biosynthesis protein TsaB [Aquificaceae bacterium]|nr:tRNA threonylcarbamoyladenosine biosynthesis protein TsaB [Aquificaceae bacterium]MDW8237713.1 tRNA threonylcarbamoyladenosine biosynthesis protein TsaB [Aquificaceae bacterium]